MEEKYIELLDNFLKEIDIIDGETPWQERKPEWWLQMMTMRKIAQQYRSGYDC